MPFSLFLINFNNCRWNLPTSSNEFEKSIGCRILHVSFCTFRAVCFKKKESESVPSWLNISCLARATTHNPFQNFLSQFNVLVPDFSVRRASILRNESLEWIDKPIQSFIQASKAEPQSCETQQPDLPRRTQRGTTRLVVSSWTSIYCSVCDRNHHHTTPSIPSNAGVELLGDLFVVSVEKGR